MGRMRCTLSGRPERPVGARRTRRELVSFGIRAVGILAIVVVVGLPWVCPHRAAADAAPVEVRVGGAAPGGAVTPRMDAPVRLDEEMVYLQILPDRTGGRPVPVPGTALSAYLRYVAQVRAEFLLVPEADAHLEVGFPRDPAWVPQVEVEVEGRSLAWRASEDGRWALWSMDFRRGRPVRLTVRYRQLFVLESPDSPLELSYVLKTGAAWKGPIGRARIVVELPVALVGEDVMEARPGGHRIEGGKLVWDLERFEPEEDVMVRLRNVLLGQELEEARRLLSGPGAVLGPREVWLIRLVGALAGETARAPHEAFPGFGPVELETLYRAGEELLGQALAGDSSDAKDMHLHYLAYVLERPAALPREPHVLTRAFRAAEAYLDTLEDPVGPWLELILRELGVLARDLYALEGDAQAGRVAARVLCLAAARYFFGAGGGRVEVIDRVVPVRGGTDEVDEKWRSSGVARLLGRAKLSGAYGWVGELTGDPPDAVRATLLPASTRPPFRLWDNPLFTLLLFRREVFPAGVSPFAEGEPGSTGKLPEAGDAGAWPDGRTVAAYLSSPVLFPGVELPAALLEDVSRYGDAWLAQAGLSRCRPPEVFVVASAPWPLRGGTGCSRPGGKLVFTVRGASPVAVRAWSLTVKPPGYVAAAGLLGACWAAVRLLRRRARFGPR